MKGLLWAGFTNSILELKFISNKRVQRKGNTGTCAAASSLAKWVWMQSICAMVWNRGCKNGLCDSDEQRQPRQRQPHLQWSLDVV